MLKYLLGDTVVEAEQAYKEYKPMLLNICKKFSEWSGVCIDDLFGDAIIALGDAKDNYNPSLGSSFKSYASYYILTALNDSIRKNNSVIVLPNYLFRAQATVRKIKNILSKYLETKPTVFDTLTNPNYIDSNIEQTDQESICHYKDVLTKLAKNSNTTYEDLVDTVLHVPTVTDMSSAIETPYENHDGIMAKLLLTSLRKNLTTFENSVVDKLLEGVQSKDLHTVLSVSKAKCKKALISLKTKFVAQVEEEYCK